MEKKWIFLDQNVDSGTAYAISSIFSVSPLLSTVMINRGLSDAADAKIFLEKSILGIHSPFLMKDMDKAVKRIEKAKEQNEKVTVYGDYDVDGVTATTVLVLYLRYFGLTVDYYIPERQGEGYGVHRDAIEEMAKGGSTLIVTVDTGITALEEVEYAKSLGVDMIITDHHRCKETVPNACAVLNPKQADCPYPFKDLSGVGVAFKLACALAGEDKTKRLLYDLGDLVALGTIADVVSLLDENRIFVHYGIEKMNKTPIVGLEKIMGLAHIQPKDITSQNVSYMIAPRINAAGRMGKAVDAVKLFLTSDPDEAYHFAADLDDMNRERQIEESGIVKTADDLLATREYDNDEVLVLAHENWHHGIIGIVASRVMEKYNKPTILISLDGEVGKGSGRSIGNFNLFDALSETGEHLIKYGGHALAAGLTIEKDKIDEFRRAINCYAREHQNDIPEMPILNIDSTISGKDFNLTTICELRLLEPFGMDNYAPVFALMRAKIKSIRQMSEGKHVKFTVIHDGEEIDVLGFSKGYLADAFTVGDEVDVAGDMDENYYNGITKVQMRLRDIRKTSQKVKETYITYEELQTAFRQLKQKSGEQNLSKESLCEMLSANGLFPITKEKAINFLKIFCDCGFLEWEEKENFVHIRLLPANGKKVDILNSDQYLEIKRMADYD